MSNLNFGVVGVNGYIGSYLYNNLIQNGYSVVSIDNRYKEVDLDVISKLDIIIYTGGVTSRGLCEVLNDESISKNNIDDIVFISSCMITLDSPHV